MVISQLVRETAKRLSENPLFEAEQMVMSVCDLDRTELVLKGRNEVSEEETEKVNDMVLRRLKGEPLQYIIGECEFMSLKFYTERGVLIPRSDTETLVEKILDFTDENEEYKVLDICTGTGCIGISIANYRKKAEVKLLDISDTAIDLAKRNIVLNDVSDRVFTEKKDILKDYPKEKYDIIVSNPPYIESDVIDTLQVEVKDYEPHLALDGGKDGLIFYRRIVDIAPDMLNKDGILAFEIGYNQGSKVLELMEKNFYNIQIIKDLCGNDRVVIGIRR